MQKNYETLSGHTIVCGYGRNGRQTVKELISHDHKVLVIETKSERVEQLKSFPEVYYLVGDATLDEVLQAANIINARALITTMPKDADNLFIVLTSRLLNADMRIVSRASEFKLKKKLLRAGATEVILPDMLGGQHMANLVTEPDLVEFIDYILLQNKEQVNLEEISVKRLDKSFVKKTIRELNIRNISQANIIGVKTIENRYVLNPPADFLLGEASHIFALGNPEQIERLKELIVTGE